MRELWRKQKPKRVWTLISGRTINVDSGWEGKMYDLLLSWNINFTYVREQPFRFKIGTGKQAWFPDFIINSNGEKIIVEIKGHPLAFKVWKEKFPLICESEETKDWKLVVVDKDPATFSQEQVETYESFISNFTIIQL